MRMALGLALLLSVAAWGQHFNLTLTGPGSAKLTVRRDTAAANFRVMALSISGPVRTVMLNP